MAEVDICFLSLGGPVHEKCNKPHDVSMGHGFESELRHFLDIPSIFFMNNGDVVNQFLYCTNRAECLGRL